MDGRLGFDASIDGNVVGRLPIVVRSSPAVSLVSGEATPASVLPTTALD